MESIDEAIAAMDDLIDRALDTGDPRGYFTCVYRAVTARVREGIRGGEFDDCERMERFHVAFARLYLDATEGFDAGREVSRSWRVFEAPPTALAVQHVMAGMNAHINLDLGLAAAQVQCGLPVGDLQADFERLNDVLAAMIDRMQEALTHTAPWTAVADEWTGRVDELVSGWSIEYARGRAWAFASGSRSPVGMSTTPSSPLVTPESRQWASGSSIRHCPCAGSPVGRAGGSGRICGPSLQCC